MLPILPFEILERICSYLELIDLLELARTSKSLEACCLTRRLVKSAPLVIGFGAVQSTQSSRKGIVLNKRFLRVNHKLLSATEILTTYRYHDMNREILSMLVTFLPSLKHVDFSNNVELDDECIKVLTLHCPHIRHLNLSRCRSLTSKCLHNIALQLEHIKSLNLSNTRAATSQSIMHFLACAPPSFKELRVSRCYMIDWDVMGDVLGAYDFSFVDFSSNWGVTGAFLKHFGEARSRMCARTVCTVDVQDCEQLTLDDVQDATRIAGGSVIRFQQNCRLKNHSEESVRQYLVELLGA